MQHVSQILPTANSQLDKNSNQLPIVEVDQLLIEHAALIEPQFAKWFAKCFYSMDREIVNRLASEAKADGKDPKRLFSYLIKKYAKSTR